MDDAPCWEYRQTLTQQCEGHSPARGVTWNNHMFRKERKEKG